MTKPKHTFIKFSNKRPLYLCLTMSTVFVFIIAVISGILVSYSSHKFIDDDHLSKLRYNDRRCASIDQNQGLNFCSPYVLSVTDDDSNFTIPDEHQISRDGHVNGVKPIFYNWTMNFVTRTSFIGKISILIEIVRDTNQIVIDLDSEAINVTYDQITITELYCLRQKEICISNLTVISTKNLLLITMNETLSANETYSVNFERFYGSPLKSNSDAVATAGSKGLRLTSDILDIWAINTIFQMRLARTVFPCFDHPSLKTQYQICVEHSSDTVSLSNTVLDTVRYLYDGTRRLDCFQPTPNLPTYLVTISLLSNFTSIVDDSEIPTIEIFYPIIDENDTFSWEIYETRKVLQIVENTTGLTFDLSRLAFINLNPNPFWGIENYGLISLESGFTRYAAMNEAHLILVHEIVHQWLGDVVTTKVWDEICLQEGLTSYLEWSINDMTRFNNQSLSSKLRQTIEDNLDKNHALPLIRPYNITQEIVNNCFGKPPVIFHMISVAVGDRDLWSKFLTILVQNYSYSNANLDDWVDILNRRTGAVEFGYMLHSWFTEPGYPIIYAEIVSDQIRIEQKIFLNENSLNSTPPTTPVNPRTIPLSFMFETSDGPEMILLKSINQSIEVKSISTINRGFVIDADTTTFSRKIYSVQNYLALIECYFYNNSAPCVLNRAHIKSVFSDFCFALNNNLLPWTDGSDSFREDLWLELFEKMKSLENFKNHLQINSICNCCLKTEEEIKGEKLPDWHKDSCSILWRKYCKRLRIISILNDIKNN